jgi:pantetheine-phosphate adenylyltransferase
MKVCIGGTFDILHDGHKSLIKKAFEVAGNNGYVFIGITSGHVIKHKKVICSFEERKNSIERFLTEQKTNQRFEIKPIDNKFGPSITEDFEAIIVSPATKPTAQEINEKRKELKKNPLKIIEIPYVLAQDRQPISSTRIKRKEIDDRGNIVHLD